MAIEKFLSSIVVDGTISKVGGTSSQFLKADGSVDSSSYQTIGATHYVGTTLIANNRASAVQTLTGVSIDGNSGGVNLINGNEIRLGASLITSQLYVNYSGGGSISTYGFYNGSGALTQITASIINATGGNSTNWNTAFGWGNHAGLYSLSSHTHTFASLTSKPTTLAGYGITDAAPISGSANYIQNQNASAQSANMWIRGNSRFSGTNPELRLDSDITNTGNRQSKLFFTKGDTNLWKIYNDIGANNTQTFSIKDEVSNIDVLKFSSTGAATFSSNITAADIYGAAFIGSGGAPSNNTESGGVIGIRHSPDKSFYDSFYFYSRDGSDHDGFGNASMACNAEEGIYMSTSNLAGTLVATIGVNAGGEGVILSATNQITIDTPNTYISGKVSLGQSTYHKPATTQCAGEIVYYGTGTTVAGKLYYLSTGLVWTLADSDAAASSSGMLGIAIGTNPATNGMLVRGSARFDALTPYTAMTAGQILYVSTTAGDFTATAPTGTGKVVRVIGYCVDDIYNTLYFCPDNTWIELT